VVTRLLEKLRNADELSSARAIDPEFRPRGWRKSLEARPLALFGERTALRSAAQSTLRFIESPKSLEVSGSGRM